MKWMKVPLVLVMCFLFINCVSEEVSSIECARFSLDDADYNTAITCANSALTANSSNVQAASLLADAYLGRGGFDILDIVQEALELNSNEDVDYGTASEILPVTGDQSDLRSAVLTLESLSGIDNANPSEEMKDVLFNLAKMQVLEIFSRGIYKSGYFTDTFDVTLIGSVDKDIVQADLVSFDNRLAASDVDTSEEEFEEIRQIFCILEPISSGEGFTLSEYRALVGCQLKPNTFDPTTVSEDADGDGTLDITTCAQLNPDNQSNSVQSCYNSNTQL